MRPPKLKMLPVKEYVGVNQDDPIRFYSLPIIGLLYRRRIELCLGQLQGGGRILEIGFGSGVTFFNLHDNYSEIYGLDLTADIHEIEEFFSQRSIPTYLQNGTVLQMPYADDFFDAVLLISILEHLQSDEQVRAFHEIKRVLKPGGQVVYGVPVERPLMHFLFSLLTTNIREQHLSTEKQVFSAACSELRLISKIQLSDQLNLLGEIYQVANFTK